MILCANASHFAEQGGSCASLRVLATGSIVTAAEVRMLLGVTKV